MTLKRKIEKIKDMIFKAESIMDRAASLYEMDVCEKEIDKLTIRLRDLINQQEVQDKARAYENNRTR